MKQRNIVGLKGHPVTFDDITDKPLSDLIESCETPQLYLCAPLDKMSREYVEQPLKKGWNFARPYIHKFRSPIFERHNRTVAVKLAGESWLPGCVTAAAARLAWQELGHDWFEATGLPLLNTPSKTGQAWLWKALPRDRHFPALSDDVAALIKSNSPQHRIEIFEPDYSGPEYAYDGRWMYAALCYLDRLPVGEAYQTRRFDPYTPGWYRVRVTVPDDWEHIGLIPCPVEKNGTPTWEYPNTPGQVFEVWVSEPELTFALKHWRIEVLEGWAFHRGRPLERWRNIIVELRQNARNEYARAAYREILNHTIGSFHSNTYERELIVDNAAYRVLVEKFGYQGVQVLERLKGGNRRVLTREVMADKLSIYMPHWSATVWALERARIAQHAMMTARANLIEIRGDAIYSKTRLPFVDNKNLGQIRFQGEGVRNGR